ncbi:AI-2E family transporter [Oceaniovalibus guishaninsula]|nr:AI-2E family transporter [Oceaniovalibus guishaninsula]
MRGTGPARRTPFVYPAAVRSAIMVIAIVVLAMAFWKLSFVALLAFAGVLIAVLLRHAANALARHTPLSPTVGVIAVVLTVIAVIVAFFMTLGPRIASEMGQIAQILPETIRDIESMLQNQSWGDFVLRQLPDPRDGTDWNVFGAIGGTLSTVISAATNIVVLVSVAVFLAVNPGLYRRGVLHLVPRQHRDRAGEVLDALGQNLWFWLLGQMVDMAFVAVLTGLGLWLIGVPLAVTLGLIAGITNFIPYVGPFISAVPAILIAFANEPSDAIWTAVVFIAVQQLEGNVLMPLIQKRAVSLPPALSVLAILAFGVMFGFIGLLIATPLMLSVMVLVQMLYVQDVLEDDEVSPKVDSS